MAKPVTSLGQQGGAKSILRGVQIFETMSSTLFQGGGRNESGHGPPTPPLIVATVYILESHNENRKFSCILYALSQFLCTSASFKLSTLRVRHSSRIPSLLDCDSTRHSRSLVFCSCELPCRSVGCVLLQYVQS